MIGAECESQGLYHLIPTSFFTVCSSVANSPSLLHNCYGHPNLSKLHHLDPSLSKLNTLECESCQLGKHSRTSPPSKLNKRIISPFNLVHSDIWGPSRTESALGFRYFFTVVDDFSRCTRLYMIKKKLI